jgi:hypothetical protein
MVDERVEDADFFSDWDAEEGDIERDRLRAAWWFILLAAVAAGVARELDAEAVLMADANMPRVVTEGFQVVASVSKSVIPGSAMASSQQEK